MATIEETLDKAIEVAVKRAILKAHPVGSLYLSLTSDNPADLLGGVWTKVGSGRCLWGADSSHGVGSEISAGLPNISGYINAVVLDDGQAVTASGALSVSVSRARSWTGTTGTACYKTTFNASGSNSLYGASSTVQPPALAVNIWKRTQ